MGESNPNQKQESNQPAQRTWGQRLEIIGLGAVGTAIGVGARDLVRHVASKAIEAATDEPVRRAAAFGRGLKCLFG